MRRLRGFTLLEVLMVIAIVAVLLAIVWPDFGAMKRGEQLPESAYRIKALVAMCRAEAMNQARRFRVSFRQDGSIRVLEQLDPILAPQDFVEVEKDWADGPFLMEDAWVEAIQPLPAGPAPILVEDDSIQFTTLEDEPVPVEQLEKAVALNFEPDGSCGSARWRLRDANGMGMLMTLDGRLGRVQIEPSERIPADQVQRPAKLSEEEDKKLALDRSALELKRQARR